MWVLKVITIVLGLASIAVAPIAVCPIPLGPIPLGPIPLVKSLPMLKSGSIRETKAGVVLLACRAAMFLLGLALFYFTFTF